MQLPQSEINRSAIMAAVLTKDQSREGLQKILDETATDESLKEFEAKLRAQLAQITKKPIEALSEEFMSDLVDRICSNAKYKLTLKIEE